MCFLVGNLIALSAWSEAEPPVGLISACLPTYVPLIRKLSSKMRSSVAAPGYISSGSRVTDPTASNHHVLAGGATKFWVSRHNESFVPLGEGDGDSQIALTDRRRDRQPSDEDVEHGIRVRRDIHVTEDHGSNAAF